MEKFMSVILGFFLFIYLFGIVGRFLLRYYISRKMKQFSNGSTQGGFYRGGFANGSSRASQNSNNSYKEGEVFVSADNKKEKRVNEKVGEYVDFEEVK